MYRVPDTRRQPTCGPDDEVPLPAETKYRPPQSPPDHEVKAAICDEHEVKFDALQRVRQQTIEAWRVSEKHLNDRDYALGDALTMADIPLGV